MDDLDRAECLEQMERDLALQQIKARDRSHLPSREDCLDCSFDIEAERKALGGALRCSECQGYYLQEQRQKGLRA